MKTDELVALREMLVRARKGLGIFMGEDERFQPMMGWNPYAMDKMFAEQHALIADMDALIAQQEKADAQPA